MSNRLHIEMLVTGQPHERRHPLEDGGVKITTFVPLKFKKRGVRKVVVGPDGVEAPVMLNASVPAIPASPDATLLKALGRGHFWQHLLDSGTVADTGEIAAKEGIHRATVSEVLRLALLDPDIVQAAFEGKLPRTMSLESLLRTTFPLDWGKQRDMIAALGTPV